MLIRLISWGYWHLRPREGWLPFWLLVATVFTFLLGVDDVGWVAEDGVIWLTALLSFGLAQTLARRPTRALIAWPLVAAYVALATWLNLAGVRLSPLLSGWWAFSAGLRQGELVFRARFLGWLAAVLNGRATQETLVFAAGLGVAAGLLAAYAAWATVRQRRPLAAVVALGSALGVNSYFSGRPIVYVGFFIATGALLTAVLHYRSLEAKWEQQGTDYATEIAQDVAIYAGMISLSLLLVAALVPRLRIAAVAEVVQAAPAVQRAEAELERIFGGVRPPEGAGSGGRNGVGAAVGVMPRAYLMGNPPELADTPVLRGRVTPNPAALHWRAASFDIYTGTGWAFSAEIPQPLSIGEAISSSFETGGDVITQTVAWLTAEPPRSRYTVGRPQRLDEPVLGLIRATGEMARVLGAAEGAPLSYTAVSTLPAASEAALRAARLADVPPALLSHYTALPDTVPERVRQLAWEVTAAADNPYDQARALELFLRQYPYDLDVPLPPRGVDSVDYFLFELQRGYCDYYASSMVVMARSVGLPARMGIGFLAQPPDADGWQTLVQLNGHSWAEVYFAGIGWVEFEPTAPFPQRVFEATAAQPAADQPPALPSPPPPVPEKSGVMRWPWLLGVLFVIAAVIYWLREQVGRSVGEQDGVLWAHAQVRRAAEWLGQPYRPSETPHEFGAHFSRWLAWLGAAEGVVADVQLLTALFERRLYAKGAELERPPHLQPGSAQGHAIWQRIRRPLWRLRLRQIWRRAAEKGGEEGER